MAYRTADGTQVLIEVASEEERRRRLANTGREQPLPPATRESFAELAKFLEGIMETSPEERAAALDRWADRFRQAAEDVRLGQEIKIIASDEDLEVLKDVPLLDAPGEEELSNFLSSIKDAVEEESNVIAETPSQRDLRDFGRPKYFR